MSFPNDVRPQQSKAEHDASIRKERRLLAAELLRRGYAVAQVARTLGVSRQAVYKWKTLAAQARKGSLERSGGRGRKRVLDRNRIAELVAALAARSDIAGFSRSAWSARLLTYAVNTFFDPEFDYHRTQVWRILRTLGWSFERCAKAERARLETWFFQRWPGLQRRLRREFLEDARRKQE